MDKKYGKLVRIMVLTLVGTMLLSSCFPAGNGKSIPPDGEGKMAEIRFHAIMKAIEGKDKEALKLMFSKTVRKESKDLDENIEYLFTLIPSEMQSWERLGTGIESKIEYGDKEESLNVYFHFQTKEEKYSLHFMDCVRDDFDVDGVGLDFLGIVKEADKQRYWGKWNGVTDFGVFKPEEE